MSPPVRAWLLLLLTSAAACVPSEGARGAECIAPAAAGGGWDLTCRLLSRVLAEADSTVPTMRTVNMPGAGGGVGFAHAVGRRAGDPSVILAASPATTLRLAQGQFGPLEVDDVRWVGALGAEYGIVAVAQDAPWPSLGALMDEWRREPEAIVVSGGSAVAGQDHMKVLLLAREAGMDPRRIRYVPFDGGGEAMTALLGGFVHVFAGEASEVEGQLEAGRIRILAVLAPERLEGWLSHVPTAVEQDLDVTWVTWRGFYIPPAESEVAYGIWVDRLRRVGATPEWEEALVRSRLLPFTLVGEEFERFVADQVSQFQALARDIGLLE